MRASPDWELVQLDDLPTGDLESLGDLAYDPEIYGVLRPRQLRAGRWKAVWKDTALLLLALREPAPLPRYLRLGSRRDLGHVAELVLDGVLEVEENGRFVSGPAALPLLGSPAPLRGRGALARLSLRGLRCAEALELDSDSAIAAYLYAFNSQPETPQRARVLRGERATRRFLRLGDGSGVRAHLDAGWQPEGGSPRSAWLAWTRREGNVETSPAKPTYKLYVSPAVADVPAVLAALAELLPRGRTLRFKVGVGPRGLLRPDKIVAYFATFEDLAETAAALTDPLQELAVRPQGVPFTAEIAGEGLLSWGLDPPRKEAVRESWRTWVSTRLATALLEARRSPPSELSPWRCALERLRLGGLDVEGWTPDPDLWLEAGF